MRYLHNDNDDLFFRDLFVALSLSILTIAAYSGAERQSISEEQVLNEGMTKRPGNVKHTTRTMTTTPIVMTDLNSSTTGSSEVQVLNFTDQDLCLKTVARTSATAPSCPLSNMCSGTDVSRLETIGAEAYLLPKNDTYGYGILCANAAAAVTNGEFAYTIERDQ